MTAASGFREVELAPERSFLPRRRIPAVLLLCLMPAFVAGSGGTSEPPPAPRRLRGVALALHPGESERQGFEYPPDPASVAEFGATHVVLAPTWTLTDVRADDIRPGDVSDTALRSVIRRAHRVGLGVVLLPHLMLERASVGEWRGSLRPRDEARFFRSYARFIHHYAVLAAHERIEALVIGSELSSLTQRRHSVRWSALAADIRQRFSGRLVYVTNHDALDRDAAFASVDVVGVSAYFPLSTDREASLESLRASWRKHAANLRRFAHAVGKPLWLAELGYPSRDGAALAPWDDTTAAPADLEEQRRAFAAARLGLADEGAWGDGGWLEGVAVWTVFGLGGRADRHFTFVGKPASAEVERLLRSGTERR